MEQQLGKEEGLKVVVTLLDAGNIGSMLGTGLYPDHPFNPPSRPGPISGPYPTSLFLNNSLSFPVLQIGNI